MAHNGAQRQVKDLVAVGVTSRPELMRLTGLSLAQVVNALRRLREQGVIAQRKKAEPNGTPIVYKRYRCLLSEIWK